MAKPLVSVLIRSLGRGQLAQALSSALKQTYTDLEILVVAAVPQHPPLPLSMDDERVQLHETATSLQRSVAANKALDLARGTYCLILDDDDWIAPEHIAQLVDALQSNPGYALVYCQTQTVNAQGDAAGMPVMGHAYDPVRLLAANWMPPHSILFETKLRALGCRFDESLDLYEDWDFWLQVAQHSDFLYLPKMSAFYRIHDSSGVHQHAAFFGEASRLVYEKWRKRWTPQHIAQLMDRSWKNVDQATTIGELQEAQRGYLEQLRQSNTELANTQTELANTQTELANTQTELANTQTELANTQTELANTRTELARLMRSRSWRLSAPLRSAGRQARGIKRSVKALIQVFEHTLPKLRRLPALLRSEGWRGVMWRVQHDLKEEDLYQVWIRENEPSEQQFPALREQVKNWRYQPLVTVLMPTYNSPLAYLQEAVQSVMQQVYPHWELCIADDASTDPSVKAYLTQLTASDPRVRVHFRPQNGHISASSNTALAMAQGDWTALLDHDDRLHPLALFHLALALQATPEANIVFSDEDKIDAHGVRYGPYFKGDYNRELMWAQNMISHLGCYRRQTLLDIGGFRQGFEGSQDYDLALRVIERSEPGQIVHIAQVLYHWRAIVGSTALGSNEKPYAETASRKALKDHLSRLGIDAAVSPAPEIPNMNRVQPALPAPLPLVSILIPTRDRIELLKVCIDSIRQRSTYPHIELIVIDNGSVEPESLHYFDDLRQTGVRIIRGDGPFNFSALNNLAARAATGEFLCLMNNDIEVTTPNWLEEMLSFAARPGIGAVGTRLWYPQGQGLQHGGVVVGLGGVAGHAHVGLPRGQVGYFGRVALHHRLVAVTAACLLIRKSHYWEVGGFDEQLAVAFNDVDFCLRLHQAGLACIFTPYAEMTHHESASRGNDLDESKRERFMAEERFMKSRWKEKLAHDPFYSPNLSMHHSDFRPASKRHLPS